MADKLTDKGNPKHEWLPAHSDVRQSAYSVAFPRQNPSPALHARALTVDPKSQVVEHWDQSLHSSHMPVKNRTNRLKNNPKKKIVLPGHAPNVQSLASVASPGHVSLPPGIAWLHARALNSLPSPQVDVHWVHGPQSCHVVLPTEKKRELWKTIERKVQIKDDKQINEKCKLRATTKDYYLDTELLGTLWTL